MIRLKRSISIIVLLLGIANTGFTQNLFDLAHSRQYAAFLEQSQQHSLAAIEFERLLFMEPGNLEFRKHLVRAYRFSDQYSLGISRINDWYPLQVNDTILFQEYIKLNMLKGTFSDALLSLEKQSILPVDEAKYYQLAGIVLQKNWQGSKDFVRNNPDEQWPGFFELSTMIQKYDQIKFRKPGIALGLSTIVPGLGKIYTKDWKDGLISFLFVAGNAFQAYRGFSKDGINSVYGWIFGTMSFGFYTGNLYGSWKSAKNFNLRSEEVLYNEIQHSIYDRF